MTFVFPEGLAPDVYPLAWLVGKWRGVGEIGYHDEIPTQRIVSEITFDHDGGPYLRYESKIKILGAGPAAIPGPVLESEGLNSPEVQALLAEHSDDAANISSSTANSTSRCAQTTDGATSSLTATSSSSCGPATSNAGRGSQDRPAAENSSNEPPTGYAAANANSTSSCAQSAEPTTSQAGVPDDSCQRIGGVEDRPAAENRTDEPPTGYSPPSSLQTPDAPTEAEIAAAPVFSAETGYWRVSALRDGGLANNEFPLEVFIANSDGGMMYLNGFASPARVELASAKVIRSGTAPQINGSKRMYGFVGGQLAWAEDIVAFGYELGSYASALLTRIDAPSPTTT